MAKLTDEQKLENKAARSILEKDFKKRRNEYEAVKEKALRDFDANEPLKSQAEAANAAMDAAMHARDQETNAITLQIAGLQVRIKGLQAKYDMDRLNNVRRETNDAYYKGKGETEKAVDAMYPDMAGVWSANEWAKKLRDGKKS